MKFSWSLRPKGIAYGNKPLGVFGNGSIPHHGKAEDLWVFFTCNYLIVKFNATIMPFNINDY